MNIRMNKADCSTIQIEDKKISWVLMAPFIILTAQYFFLLLNDMLGLFNILTVQLVSKVLVGILFIYAMPVVIKRRIVTFIMVYLMAIFIFLSHYVIFPENYLYMSGILFPFFFMCLPVYIYSLSLNDWSILKLALRKAGLLVFIFGAASGVLVLLGLAQIGDYSMALSYYMLLPAIIFLDELLDKPAFKASIITLFSIFIILALGSRGAIICIIVFFGLKMIRPTTKMNFIRVFLYLITIFLSILTIMNLKRILMFIYGYFSDLGIKSRTLELFLLDINHLSGREQIYQNIKEEILLHPILGIGIGGDRRVNGGEGLYAHNLFLEVLSNFGIFFGGVLLFILLCFILKAVFAKQIVIYHMAIIWISLGLVHLMVSSSYLMDINFWILLGLLTNNFFRKRQEDER